MRSNSVFTIMSLGMMVLTLSFLVWPITPAMPPTMATVTSKTVGCVIVSSSGVGSLTGVRMKYSVEAMMLVQIRNIHSEGKKVLVWTANEKGSQRHFLCSEADGIITDNVRQAVDLTTVLEERSDIDRMVDKIKTIM